MFDVDLGHETIVKFLLFIELIQIIISLVCNPSKIFNLSSVIVHLVLQELLGKFQNVPPQIISLWG